MNLSVSFVYISITLDNNKMQKKFYSGMFGLSKFLQDLSKFLSIQENEASILYLDQFSKISLFSNLISFIFLALFSAVIPLFYSIFSSNKNNEKNNPLIKDFEKNFSKFKEKIKFFDDNLVFSYPEADDDYIFKIEKIEINMPKGFQYIRKNDHGEMAPFQALNATKEIFRSGDQKMLIGQSGCGKSTLFLIMCGIVNKNINRGEVMITWYDKEGKKHINDIKDINPRALRKRIIMVPQIITLPKKILVKEVIRIFLPDATDKQIRAYLYLGGAYPEVGLNRPVGSLSGGQLQRVLISSFLARILNWSYDFIFLDETYVGLDFNNRRKFLNVFFEMFPALYDIVQESKDNRSFEKYIMGKEKNIYENSEGNTRPGIVMISHLPLEGSFNIKQSILMMDALSKTITTYPSDILGSIDPFCFKEEKDFITFAFDNGAKDALEKAMRNEMEVAPAA